MKPPAPNPVNGLSTAKEASTAQTAASITHGSSWEGMGFHAGPSVPTAPDTDVLQRIDGAPDVMDVIRDRIKPGTVLVTTDLSASPETRSGSGFTVMDAPSS